MHLLSTSHLVVAVLSVSALMWWCTDYSEKWPQNPCLDGISSASILVWSVQDNLVRCLDNYREQWGFGSLITPGDRIQNKLAQVIPVVMNTHGDVLYVLKTPHAWDLTFHRIDYSLIKNNFNNNSVFLGQFVKEGSFMARINDLLNIQYGKPWDGYRIDINSVLDELKIDRFHSITTWIHPGHQRKIEIKVTSSNQHEVISMVDWIPKKLIPQELPYLIRETWVFEDGHLQKGKKEMFFHEWSGVVIILEGEFIYAPNPTTINLKTGMVTIWNKKIPTKDGEIVWKL